MLKRVSKKSSRRGVTLVELLVASTLLLMLLTSLLEGILFARRSAERIKERIVADSFAWDLLWKTFNMNYDDVKFPDYTDSELQARLPMLRDPILQTSITQQTATYSTANGLLFRVQLQWKSRADNEERSLSLNLNDTTYRLFRSNNSRALSSGS